MSGLAFVLRVLLCENGFDFLISYVQHAARHRFFVSSLGAQPAAQNSSSVNLPVGQNQL